MVTYNAVINADAEKGDPEVATECFERMLKAGLEPIMVACMG